MNNVLASEAAEERGWGEQLMELVGRAKTGASGFSVEDASLNIASRSIAREIQAKGGEATMEQTAAILVIDNYKRYGEIVDCRELIRRLY